MSRDPALPPLEGSLAAAANEPSTRLAPRGLAALRRKGNPFRQQFARNSDDAACSLYHVADIFANERRILRDLVENYRYQPARPTTVLPLLGARGAGKTHLLHCLKHEPDVAPQLFVTPGTFRVDRGNADTGFLEYLLYQFINVLLSGGEQRGIRPLILVAEQITRRLMLETLAGCTPAERLELFHAGPVTRALRRLGVGVEATLVQLDALAARLGRLDRTCRSMVTDCGLSVERLEALIQERLDKEEPRDLRGALRKQILSGFIRVALYEDLVALADFLTDGFADVRSIVKPTRTQLTLTMLQALTEVIVGAGIPVAVAFDQLEELLYGQTDDEIRRSSDAFFGGVVQLMSQVPGLCVLLFVEEGLWNRIVPPLPPHILDRIHEPVHIASHGTVRHVRLSTPTAEQLTEVVARRVRRTLADFPDADKLPPAFPFEPSFLQGLAKKETVLRLMLQGCCNRLDTIFETMDADPASLERLTNRSAASNVSESAVAESAAEETELPASASDLSERWHQEVRAAERKLKPVGSLAGATVELQGGLIRWLDVCKSLGAAQDDWTLTAVEDQVSVGDHPTYGTLTVLEWSSPHGDQRRVGIGLWLGRGVGKPRDLETKLAVFDQTPRRVDHLILFRPTDDVRLSGRTEAAWNTALAAGHSLRLEPLDLTLFAKLYAFPRWMQQVSEIHRDGSIPDPLLSFLRDETQPILEKLALEPPADERRAA